MNTRAQAGLQLAQWLQAEHPEVFEAVFAQAVRQGVTNRRAQLRGFAGDDEYDHAFTVNLPEPVLQDIQIDTGNLEYVEASMYGDAMDALPGGLESLDVGVMSSTPVTASTSSSGGITGALASVGHWLTSAQGLTSLTQLGSAVLNTVATTQVAKTQMAVIQAQAQMASLGKSPAPITYMHDAKGNLVPVYAPGVSQQIPTSITTAIGQGRSTPVTLPDGSTGYTLNSSTLSSVLGSHTGLVLAGAGLLLLLLLSGSMQ